MLRAIPFDTLNPQKLNRCNDATPFCENGWFKKISQDTIKDLNSAPFTPCEFLGSRYLFHNLTFVQQKISQTKGFSFEM